MESNRNNSVLDHIMNGSTDIICTIDAAGRFIRVSAAYSKLLGYRPQDLEKQFIKDYIYPSDWARTLRAARLVIAGNSTTNFENCFIHKNGHQVPIRWSAVWSAADNLFVCIGQDLAQKAAQTEIYNTKELHRVTVEHGADMLGLLDEEGNYLYVAGSQVKELGYEPDQLIGENAFTFIHPDDIAEAQTALALTIKTQQPVKLPEFRFKTANGQWRWLEVTVSNQLNNQALKAIFVSSRDITSRKLALLELMESEQRFRSLFQNNPDMVLYQNEAGTILDANQSFLSFIKKPKEMVINRPLADFLPPAAIPLFNQKLHDAFSGRKVTFKADVNFKEIGQKVLSVVKVPLIVADKVIAVHAILEDVTAAIESHRTISQHAKKLNTILESITDAFYTLDKNWNYTYINGEFERILQEDREKLIGRNIWSSFPPEIRQNLYQPYKQAADTGEKVHFEVYFEIYQKWFDIRVYPSDEGLSVYFSDITEKVVSKKELEKLSLVASKTTNSVIITDAGGLTEWVNQGFTQMTGYTLSDVKGKKPGTVLQGPKTDPATVKRVSEKLKASIPFTEEILNYKKSGEKFWIHKEITPILNAAGEVSEFIAIQNDVTARKQAEEELKKLSLVASKTINGVIITDAQGRTEWVNAGFTGIMGYTLPEITGKKPGSLLQGPETDTAEIERIGAKLQEGVPFNSMLINYKKSGEQIWISMDISPVFDAAGEIIQFIAILKDISFRKEAETNLVKMSQDLYERNRDLQQFTYIISHNLRAPVANALGLIKLLLGLNKQSEEFDVLLNYLNESVTRLDDVLKDVNQILTIRDKKDVLKKEYISLADVCRQALEDLQEPLRQHGALVSVVIDEGLQVPGNRAYIYSIFNNLLSNALKYRSEARTLQVKIWAVQNPMGQTELHISDNGLGLDLEKVGDNIFKMYKRFHANKKGKGIGLFLVKTHVEAMGGRIAVTSQVNVGTVFTIYFNEG